MAVSREQNDHPLVPLRARSGSTAPGRRVLADHVAGHERRDSKARFDALLPVHPALADTIG
jgi:hypothetical protein